ncbi:AMP-binding protein [Azospirillum thermophilum]|uniref:Long-chain fatty acid--CoA ligase n=1 Tax=Azospirillum thermophilum TaxID=2202148 RepID=A0A2S2CLZ4_9PROT|nr:AMP-binding protein [Azospirillum thermophilum]AWK85492.1 long-chain fatty acid--CoA ligase [Azospirillum thermophilum]
MTVSAPPGWIAPGFRLIEGGTSFDREALCRLPAPAGGVVEAGRPSVVLVALAAAERAGQPILLKRHAGSDPDLPALPGFAVLLETSGTTGVPKLVRHGFDRLRGRLRGTADAGARWLLTYEPGAFAGLQVILTAAAAGATLVAEPGGGVGGLARAAVHHGVTHVSGTPSFWRAFLMALGAEAPPLAAITLGGEAADQPLLDRLAERFPQARLRHIYASTEAGALFAVADGLAGFPAEWLETGVDGVGLRIAGGVLEVRSPRAMLDGAGDWLSTGDLVELRDGRVLFAGRLDGRINVGGVKVSPEAAETALLAVPGVLDALVEPRANPISGWILTATVVPQPGVEESALRSAIRVALEPLAPAARPRVLTFADHIALSTAGKKSRRPEP